MKQCDYKIGVFADSDSRGFKPVLFNKYNDVENHRSFSIG